MITLTYLFSIFLLVLRVKVSHRSIRLFKTIGVAFFIYDTYLLIVGAYDIDRIAAIFAYVPLVYIMIMLYINELAFLVKKLRPKRRRKISRERMDNELAAKLMKAVDFLSNKKIGALITVERNMSLSEYCAKAFPVKAPVSSELLGSIFMPNSPLHDGAVIIRDNQIVCAKAYYPSTERTDLPMHYGTRHRAAIGISEQCDALTLLVSEETGNISVTINRQMDYNVSRETLDLYFEKYLRKSKQ
jgi:diadenylate cyclase